MQASRVEPDALIVSVALSASAAFVAALHPQGQAVITDIGTRIIRHVFPALPWQAPSDTITVSPQDRLVAIAQARRSRRDHRWQSTVTAWDIATGGQACSWDIPGIAQDICVSPDERLIAAITSDGAITIYDVLTTS